MHDNDDDTDTDDDAVVVAMLILLVVTIINMSLLDIVTAFTRTICLYIGLIL